MTKDERRRFWSPPWDDLPDVAKELVPRELFTQCLRDLKRESLFGNEVDTYYLYVGVLGRPVQACFKQNSSGGWKLVAWTKFHL